MSIEPGESVKDCSGEVYTLIAYNKDMDYVMRDESGNRITMDKDMICPTCHKNCRKKI